MLTKLIQFFKNLFSLKKSANMTPAFDIEPEVNEPVPDNAEIELEDSQETTQISQGQIFEEAEPKIETKLRRKCARRILPSELTLKIDKGGG